jgi:hypothetical protein
MEMTSPEKASLFWVELPQGLKFKPIGLAKDASESEYKRRDTTTSTSSRAR